MIHSGMKQATLCVSELFIQLLKRFFQNTDSFRNETSDSLCKWVIHSVAQTILSKHWFIQERNKRLSMQVSHSFSCSNDSFKTLIHSGTKQATLYASESFIQLLKRFFQNTDSFRNETSDSLCMSFIQLLKRFFQNTNSLRNETKDCFLWKGKFTQMSTLNFFIIILAFISIWYCYVRKDVYSIVCVCVVLCFFPSCLFLLLSLS